MQSTNLVDCSTDLLAILFRMKMLCQFLPHAEAVGAILPSAVFETFPHIFGIFSRPASAFPLGTPYCSHFRRKSKALGELSYEFVVSMHMHVAIVLCSFFRFTKSEICLGVTLTKGK